MSEKSCNPPCIAVDLDGVLFEDGAWPVVGNIDYPMVEAVLRVKRRGWAVIFNTCRTGDALNTALLLLYLRAGLKPDYVNENHPDRCDYYGGDCRKISADLYLEDKAVGYTRDRALEALRALPDVRESENVEAAQ